MKTLSEKVKETSSNLIHWGQKLPEKKLFPQCIVGNKVVFILSISMVILPILLLIFIAYHIFLNRLLTWFAITAVFCYYMYFRLNTSKNETWKHFLKIALTFSSSFVLVLAALIIFQVKNRGKIFIEVVMIDDQNQGTSDVLAMKIIGGIYASFEASEKFVETKFSGDDLVTIPNDIELSSNRFLLNWLGLTNIGRQQVKCIISKTEKEYTVDLLFSNVKHLLGDKIEQRKYDISSGLQNEVSNEILKKLYPLQALYLAVSNRKYPDAIAIGNQITANPEAILINKTIYKKKNMKNLTFISYILTAYAYSELSTLYDKPEKSEQYAIAESLLAKAHSLSEDIKREYDYHYFKAIHKYNAYKIDEAIDNTKLALNTLKSHADLDTIEKTIKEMVLENNQAYYSNNNRRLSCSILENNISRIDECIKKLDSIANTNNHIDDKTIKRILGRKKLLISTKLEAVYYRKKYNCFVSYRYDVRSLFRYSIEMGNKLDSVSIDEDPIYKDIINYDIKFYCEHIEPLIKDNMAKKYIQDSVICINRIELINNAPICACKKLNKSTPAKALVKNDK